MATYAKISPKMVNARNIAWNTEEEEEEEEPYDISFSCVYV